jgi:4-hydroxy-2-oxoheptanedioate aldolase
VLVGEGDLSQELGYPRQYEHKAVLDAMAKIVDTCKAYNVVVGHPHVEAANAERIIGEGYRFLMCTAPRNFGGLEKARALAGRG